VVLGKIAQGATVIPRATQLRLTVQLALESVSSLSWNHCPASRGISVQVGLEYTGSASPIRSIFQDAFKGAGLRYFNPHSFRHLLVRLGETLCQSPEQFKAWSQNLGHEGVLTTFYSYGDVSSRRQGELIHGLGKPQASQAMTLEDMAEVLVRKMREVV
jgi:hypothetical protein